MLLKYHLMEQRRQAWPELLAWAGATPLLARIWQDVGRAEAPTPGAWARQLIDELCSSGALAHDGDGVRDA